MKKDKNKIYAIQRIFEVIETGEIYDSKEFYFPFLKKLSDTSLKQLYSYPNAKGTVGDLVMLSKKMNRPVYQILKDKSYIWER
jgi:hypothetical protein